MSLLIYGQYQLRRMQNMIIINVEIIQEMIDKCWADQEGVGAGVWVSLELLARSLLEKQLDPLSLCIVRNFLDPRMQMMVHHHLQVCLPTLKLWPNLIKNNTLATMEIWIQICEENY